MEGEPWKRDAVQGELLKALGAKHTKIHQDQPRPTGALKSTETLSLARLNWKQHTPGLKATKVDWWEQGDVTICRKSNTSWMPAA